MTQITRLLFRTKDTHTQQGCNESQPAGCLSGYFPTPVSLELVVALSRGNSHLQPLPHYESLEAMDGPASWIQDDLCQGGDLECGVSSFTAMD